MSERSRAELAEELETLDRKLVCCLGGFDSEDVEIIFFIHRMMARRMEIQFALRPSYAHQTSKVEGGA